MGVLEAPVQEKKWSPYESMIVLARHVHCVLTSDGGSRGRRSLRCSSMRNSSLANRLVVMRLDMLARGRLVSGVRREGIMFWRLGGGV